MFIKFRNKLNSIKQDFTIKDLENISGIKAHTIRIWEKRYNLLHPKRTNTNIRLYSNNDLQKLLNIVLLNNNNFKISKIAKMSDNEFLNASREVVFKNEIDDQAINSLKLSMFQFDKILFNSTYDELLQKKTFREVFKDIFIPFLHHIGLLWQTDTLIPAHENFISTLIAQKIQLQTEKIQHGISKSSKTYVLFLPENEIHELGLLYLNYELILRGNFTIYLGQSLPLDNLDWFFKNSSEICFITSMTVMPYDHKIEEYFREIDLILKDTPHQLIAIGQKVNLVNIEKLQSKINLYNSVSDLLNKL